MGTRKMHKVELDTETVVLEIEVDAQLLKSGGTLTLVIPPFTSVELASRHDEIQNPFGYRLFYDRSAAGKTIKELSDLTGIPYGRLSSMETGEFVPTDEKVATCAIALGQSVEEYLSLAQESRDVFSAKKSNHERRFDD